jgi:serine/threonine protein kinase/tetratricopeptide (TPR) repeat protein
VPIEWQRLKDGFHAALELAPELRAPFVDDICGQDVEFKRELSALLHARENAGTFLSHPHGLGPAEAPRSTPISPPAHPRFRIVRRLGEGGMGIVYLAVDRDHQAQIALKTIAKMSASSLLRFKNEFRAVADVVHPNLVRMFELVGDETDWFFTMEYVEGVSFMDHVRPRGEPKRPLDVGRLRTAFPQLVEAVAMIHAAGKLHCDLKPSNVLVAHDSNRVVVLDFGLVTEIEAPIRASQSFGVAGTVAYMSPEQARGDNLTESSDWYGVGVILYEALTGRLPVGTTDFREDPALPRDLSELCLELIDRDPRRRPDGRTILQRLERPSSIRHDGHVRFVGRDSQLALLEHALREVRTGRQQTVFVHGTSGVGKSALTRHFLADADAAALVLVGRCYECESVPYKAFDSVIDNLATRLASLPDARRFLDDDAAYLARLFPVLTQLPAVREIAARSSSVADLHEVRRRAFSGFREILRRLAGSYLLIVLIDDLQWSDLDSTSLLQALLAPPNPPRLLFVGTYRSEHAETSPVLKRLLQDDGAHRIQVGQLSAHETAALARGMMGDRASAETIDAVVRESGGIPLFVEQLVHAAQIESGGTGARLSFEEVLRRRFSSLSASGRRLLEHVAVGGQPLPLGAIVNAAQIAPEQALQDLVTLRAQQWVRTEGIGKADKIEPFHDRIRESLVASLAPDALRSHHLALALALEPMPVDPEILSVHWSGCGRFEEASRYATVAADGAAETLAFNRAARLYEQALGWQPPSTEERQRLRIALAGALAHAGRSAEAGDAYLRATEDIPVAEGVVYKQHAAEQYFNHGHLEKGYSVLTDLVRAVGVRLPERGASALASLLFERFRLRVRVLPYRRPSGAAREEMLRQVDVCLVVGKGLAMIEPLRAMEFQSRALRLALTSGDPKRMAIGLALEAAFEGANGHTARRRVNRLLKESEKLASDLQDVRISAYTRFIRGSVHYLRGEWEGSLLHCREAESQFRDRCVNVWWEIDQAVSFVCWNLSYLGRLGEAAAYVRPLLKEAAERGDRHLISQLLTGMNVLIPLSQNQDPEQVRHELMTRVPPWQGGPYILPHLLVTYSQCLMDLYLGRDADAHARIARELPHIKSSMLPRVQLLRIELLGFRGRCAIAAARTVRDPAPLLAEARRAVRALERIGAPMARAYATELRSQLALATGAYEPAAALLKLAAGQFQGLEMRLRAAAAQYRLADLMTGTAGLATRSTSISTMRTLGIKDPEKMTRVWFPLSESVKAT